jgi:hypothetical protein
MCIYVVAQEHIIIMPAMAALLGLVKIVKSRLHIELFLLRVCCYQLLLQVVQVLRLRRASRTKCCYCAVAAGSIGTSTQHCCQLLKLTAFVLQKLLSNRTPAICLKSILETITNNHKQLLDVPSLRHQTVQQEGVCLLMVCAAPAAAAEHHLLPLQRRSCT